MILLPKKSLNKNNCVGYIQTFLKYHKNFVLVRKVIQNVQEIVDYLSNFM